MPCSWCGTAGPVTTAGGAVHQVQPGEGGAWHEPCRRVHEMMRALSPAYIAPAATR